MADFITLLDKRVKLRQPEGGFRPGLDSVMLAAACPAKSGEHILDLGCGVGSAGFCVLARVSNVHLTGIDIQENCITLARENITLNPTNVTPEFIHHSILNYVKFYKDDKAFQSFDHVICNPPFLEDHNHISSPDETKATAHAHMDETTLEDWIKAAFNALKSGGSLTMIHRADHTDQIIRALGKSFGATEIIPLWPKSGKPAKRIIIRTLKHRKSPAKIHQGLVLHEDNGDYTEAAENILRGALALV